MAAEFGCSHYIRKCKLVTPCCDKVYICRCCHDENEEHTVNRRAVTELICACCGLRQPVRATCVICQTRFGKYTCLECNLFDNEDKSQFHCYDCGLCRIGGANNYFHCRKCNTCLALRLIDNHKCVENASRTNCPVCVEDLHTSRTPCYVPKCGHFLHENCCQELLKKGHPLCPICEAPLDNVV
ncbi:hypothetical protein GEV33_000494 [Tenebrio molitor]|uniref:Zinc finger protein n=1 Tax=Tenebrio molitor TaxID=7067 RepID=A0A8J6HXZ8_TENMO|nr:hypothetical protein GEV33_000494 [Tenebrio molitor]